MSFLPWTLANGPGNYVDHNKYMDNMLWLFAMSKGNQALNGGFESWAAGTSFSNPSNGTSLADAWTLEKSGTSLATADFARESTTKDTGTYGMKVTISGAGSSNSLLRVKQDITDYARFKGKTVTFGARVKVGTASKVRIFVTDGVTTQFSTYHTGSGSWETLTIPITCDNAMTALTFEVEIVSDFTGDPVYIDSCFLYVTDPAMSQTARQALFYFVPDDTTYLTAASMDLVPQTSFPTAKVGRICLLTDGQVYVNKDGTSGGWAIMA